MVDDSKEEDTSVMKEELKKRLEQTAERKADNDLTTAIIDLVSSSISVDIPQGYFESRVEDAEKRFDENLKRQNMNLEEYTASINKKTSEFKKEESDEVRKSIINNMIFQKILDEKKDEVSIDEASMNQYAEQMYQYYMQMGLNKRPKDEQRRVVNNIMNEAQNRFASEAVIAYLKKTIAVTDKDAVDFKPEMNNYNYGY